MIPKCLLSLFALDLFPPLTIFLPLKCVFCFPLHRLLLNAEVFSPPPFRLMRSPTGKSKWWPLALALGKALCPATTQIPGPEIPCVLACRLEQNPQPRPAAEGSGALASGNSQLGLTGTGAVCLALFGRRIVCVISTPGDLNMGSAESHCLSGKVYGTRDTRGFLEGCPGEGGRGGGNG